MQQFNRWGAAILDGAICVHRELGPGLLEAVYELALIRELTKKGLCIQSQVPVEIYYQGEPLNKTYIIDILVEGQILLEIKAVETVLPVHLAQIITYLKLSKRSLGYLINFNVPLLKDGFRRIVYKADEF